MGLFDDKLQTGDRRDIHVYLFEGEIAELDRQAGIYGCSRGTVIGALLERYKTTPLEIPADADKARKRKE